MMAQCFSFFFGSRCRWCSCSCFSASSLLFCSSPSPWTPSQAPSTPLSDRPCWTRLPNVKRLPSLLFSPGPSKRNARGGGGGSSKGEKTGKCTNLLTACVSRRLPRRPRWLQTRREEQEPCLTPCSHVGSSRRTLTFLPPGDACRLATSGGHRTISC